MHRRKERKSCSADVEYAARISIEALLSLRDRVQRLQECGHLRGAGVRSDHSSLIVVCGQEAAPARFPRERVRRLNSFGVDSQEFDFDPISYHLLPFITSISKARNDDIR